MNKYEIVWAAGGTENIESAVEQISGAGMFSKFRLASQGGPL